MASQGQRKTSAMASAVAEAPRNTSVLFALGKRRSPYKYLKIS